MKIFINDAGVETNKKIIDEKLRIWYQSTKNN